MKKKIIISLIIMCMIILLSTFTYCIDTGEYKQIYINDGQNGLLDIGGKVIAVVQIVGISVAVIMLLILGMKYMYSSVDDKAKIKEKLIPYLTGAIILFGAGTFLQLIFNWTQKNL